MDKALDIIATLVDKLKVKEVITAILIACMVILFVPDKFLEILGVKDSIHEETEKIEHTINYDTLEKMETLINFFSKYQGIYSLLKEFQEDKHLDT